MKIGIVGSGMIVNMMMDIWNQFKDIEITAMWCRSEDKEQVEKMAVEFKIPSLTSDYDKFLENPSFDFVYIGMINCAHYEYSKKALEAGKNVVCEKPFTSNNVQAKELISIAKEKNLFIFESCLPWYCDNYDVIRRNLPKVGNVKIVECCYAQYSRRYEAYQQGKILPVFNPMLDGGALYDLGVYSCHYVMGLFGKPEEVHYFANKGFNGIDTSGVLVLSYPSFQAVCTIAKDCSAPSRCLIEGDKGYILQQASSAEVKNLSLVLNHQESVAIDEVEHVNGGFTFIWDKFLAVVNAKDYDRCYAWIDSICDVMQVMETARHDAGIQFSCD